jgi:hypothetical protein
MRKTLKISEHSIEPVTDSVTRKASIRPSSKKPESWVLQLSAPESSLLAKYCENHKLAQTFSEQEDSARILLNHVCFDAFVERFIDMKQRPSNPLVRSEGGTHTTLFILQDKYKINIASPTDDVQYTEAWGKQQAVDALVEAGLSKAKAQSFVDKEVDICIPTFFLSLQEMIDGYVGAGRKKIPPTAETRSAGEKIQRFLEWRGRGAAPQLTDAEQSAITYKKFEWQMKAGMLDRICNYVKTADELKAIFNVFTPVLMFRDQQVIADGSAASQNSCLRNAVNAVLPE